MVWRHNAGCPLQGDEGDKKYIPKSTNSFQGPKMMFVFFLKKGGLQVKTN